MSNGSSVSSGWTSVAESSGSRFSPGGSSLLREMDRGAAGESLNTIPARLRAAALEPDIPNFLRLAFDGRPDQILSYRALLTEAERLCGAWLARGLAPGERVVLVLPHSRALYTAFAAALLAGLVPCIAAPPSPKVTGADYRSQLESLLANAEPACVLSDPGILRAHAPGAYAERWLSLHELRAAADAREERGSVAIHAPAPDDVAFLQYSSGTTGTKKGVAITHRALLWQVDAYARAIALGPQDRIASWLPLYHDMGLLCCLLLPLVRRIPLVAMCPFEWVRRPAALLETVTRHRCTLAWLPNFAFSFLARSVREHERAALNLSSLRAVVNCSEPIQPESVERFRLRFAPCGLRRDALAASYAMAENTFAVTSGLGANLCEEFVDGVEFARNGRAEPVTADHPRARRILSSGRPLPDTEVRVLTEKGDDAAARVVGELAIRSPSLFTEYHRNPKATRAAFRDGLYRTGDLGYLADGHVFVVGRKDDVIIVRGTNLYPQDVERAAESVPGILAGRVVAFGVRDEHDGTERLVVLAEADETEPVAKARLAEQVRRRVSSTLDVAPADVRIVPHMWLRKSTSGKLSRGMNRTRYGAELATAGGAAPEYGCGQVASEPSAAGGCDPRIDAVREVVHRVLARSLGPASSPPADHDPLITSGRVDSLGLVELFGALEQRFGVRIPAAELSDPARVDTIASLAALIARVAEPAERTDEWTRVGSDCGTRRTPRPLRADPRLGSADDLAAIRMADETAEPSLRQRRGLRGFWSWYYRLKFLRLGIRCGRGLRVLGPLLLRIDGDARNVEIGEHVTLMPGVDLKVRENGRIRLHDGVVLDTHARLVAANDARIELGADVQVGIGTVINAGADVIVGHRTALAGYCTILASEHRYESLEPIFKQGYRHAPVRIGADVWIAAQALVRSGSVIGRGAVVATGATVLGEVPPFAVVAGSPARVIRYRG